MTLTQRAKKIGIRELARRAGISASHVCLIVQGRRNPSLKVARSLARVLEISTDELASSIRPRKAA